MRDTPEPPASGATLSAQPAERLALVWQQGQRIPAEEYLRRHPSVRADPEAVVDLVYAESLLLAQQGERPTTEECLRRFPEHAATLAEQIQLHRAMEAGASALTRPPALEGDTLGAGPGPGRGGRR
jgi:hypothetical protein